MKQDQEAFTIAPGGTVIYVWNLTILKPGPFQANATLYVYDAHLSAVDLAVRGNGMAVGGFNNVQQRP